MGAACVFDNKSGTTRTRYEAAGCAGLLCQRFLRMARAIISYVPSTSDLGDA